MAAAPIQTKRLLLYRRSEDEARAMVRALSAADRAEISASWLAELDKVGSVNPWMLGFTVTEAPGGRMVGHCGFKGPPGADKAVEIAYTVSEEYRDRGYATEAAQALVEYALLSSQVEIVRAHTLPVPNASVKVLTKCGFKQVGEVVDPDDGLVWRWEIHRSGTG